MTRAQRQESQAKSSLLAIAERFRWEPLRMREQSVRYLLHDLCADLGFCLRPEVRDAIVADPPRDPKSFARWVIEAEGLDPSDKRFIYPVLECVCDAFTRERSLLEDSLAADHVDDASSTHASNNIQRE